VLAVMDWLGADDVAVQRLAGCVAGTATVVLAGVVGRWVAGDAAGLLAAALAAVHPVLIGSDGSLMSESLYGALVALVLLLAYRLHERPGVRPAALLGAAAALAALTRAEGALLLALLLIPLVRRAPRAALAAVLAAALVVGPWTLRNWAAFDRPVLISTNDSTVLAGANCDLTYHGRFTGFWLDQCRPPAQSDNEAEIAAQFRSQGLEYAADHAGRVPAVVGVRLLRTWGFWQPGLMARESEGRNARFEQIGTAFHWLLLPLAVAGVVLLRRAGRAPVWPLVAPAVLVSITTAVGFGYPRFRHAADIAIVVLAAAALAWPMRTSLRMQAEN
jgi:4-amino-4-deoxy-L-arabinose transferase-like glycosyltransferase